MTTLKPKTALNKLLKGETLYHSVFDERVEPVQMVEGKTINPETGSEWSFNDFTQFYKSKEIGEKDLKQKREASSIDYDSMWKSKEEVAKAKKAKQDQDHIDRKQNAIKKLTPVMNELNKALKAKGFEFFMHTNESHSPCPAIHLKGSQYGTVEYGTAAYNICKEIYITNYESNVDYIKSGTCNMHNYKSKDVNDLIERIMNAHVQQQIGA